MRMVNKKIGKILAVFTSLALVVWAAGAHVFTPVLAAPTTAVITSPAPGETVSGTVEFMASYNDGEVDDTADNEVQWAIREGSCDAGTVAGNVDGFNDEFNWDGHDFSATIDMSAFTDGDYCFVFNPSDPDEDNDARETQEFVLASADPGPVDENAIRVCKILLDANGDVVADAGGDALFEVTLGSDDNPTFAQTISFDGRLDLNADLFPGHDGNEAECMTVSDLPAGTYSYTEESVDSDLGFEVALYNDDFDIGVTNRNDLSVFGSDMYSDGTIVLGDDADPDIQTLVFLNQMMDEVPDPGADNSIQVCKMLTDNEGNVIAGTGIDGAFQVTLTSEDDPDFSQTVTFDTALDLNTDIFMDTDIDANDAECITVDNLPDGNYFYTEEAITSDLSFESALYYDNFDIGTTAMVDMSAYDQDNDFSDGVIVLGDTARSGENQVLVIRNQLTDPVLPNGDNTLRICKTLFDEDGNITAGGDSESSFSFTLTSELYPSYSQTLTFDTALDLNSDLFTDIDGNDAECAIVDNLPDGSYFYTEESIDSDLEFESARYYDDFEIGTSTLSDLIAFDSGNAFADGTVVLGDDGDAETQTVVVRNQMTGNVSSSGGGGSVLNPVDRNNDNNDNNRERGQGIVLGASTSNDDDDNGLTDREIVEAVLNAVPRGQVAGAQVAYVPAGAVAAGAGGAYNSPSDGNIKAGAVTASIILILAGIAIAIRKRSSFES